MHSVTFTTDEAEKLLELGFDIQPGGWEAIKYAFREYDESSYFLRRTENDYTLATESYDDEDRQFDTDYEHFSSFEEFLQYFV